MYFALIQVYMYMYIHVYTCSCVHTHVCIHVYVCLHMYACRCIYVCVHMWVPLWTCPCPCISVCVPLLFSLLIFDPAWFLLMLYFIFIETQAFSEFPVEAEGQTIAHFSFHLPPVRSGQQLLKKVLFSHQ